MATFRNNNRATPTGVVFLISVLLWSASGADDEPYVEFVMRVVSEGLAAKTSPSASVRFEGARVVSMYANKFKEEEAPRGFITSTSTAILDWLQAEQEPWIRYALLDGLAEVDKQGNQKWVVLYLRDHDPTMRARAAGQLLESCWGEVEQTILNRYPKERLWWIKAAFLECLGGGRSEASLEVLHKALSDSSRDVRAAATSALSRRQDFRSVPFLIEAIDSADLIGQDSPVWALGIIADGKAVPALEKAARAPYAIVRKGAAWALGRISDPASLDLLVILANDPDAMVRMDAIDALGELGGVGPALELLNILDKKPSERSFYALLRVDRNDISSACDQFLMEPKVEPSALDSRRELCQKALDHADDDDVEFFSTGELHSMFYSAANAKAREIWPSKGRKAYGWEGAIGKKLGGKRGKLDRGARVTIWSAAFYHGVTWLEVATGPYGGNLWIQESDLRPVLPEMLKDETIWTNYGADTRTRVRKRDIRTDNP